MKTNLPLLESPRSSLFKTCVINSPSDLVPFRVDHDRRYGYLVNADLDIRCPLQIDALYLNVLGSVQTASGCHLICGGSVSVGLCLQVGGNLEVLMPNMQAGGWIEVAGHIKVVGDLVAWGWIYSDSYIEADGDIIAHGPLESRKHIQSGRGIMASSFIEADGDIVTGKDHGIVAGLHISSKGNISCGLNLFAGTATWTRNYPDKKIITCKKLAKGKIEYGIWNELQPNTSPAI